MKRLREKTANWLYKLADKLTDPIRFPLENTDSQKAREHLCVEAGHDWKTTLGKSEKADDATTSKRVYCARCGQRYHQHIYRNL